MRLFFSALTALLLLLLVFFVPDGQILSDAQNAYYVGQTPQAYTLYVRPYGLCLAAAALCAFLTVWLCKKKLDKKASFTEISAFSALSLALGILFSRTLYCAANILFYAQEAQPLAALRIDEGGLSMTGALLGGALAAFIVAKKTGSRRLMDAAAPALAVFVLIARLGERWTRTGFGPDVEFGGLFSIADDFGAVLNVWLLEALTALLVAAALILLLRRARLCPGDGLLLFFLLYGVTQILMESLRADRHMIWGFVKAEQVFSMGMAAWAALSFAVRARRFLLAAVSSVITALLAFGLEKALDRLDISALVLYAGYALVLCAYLAVCVLIVKRAEQT